VRRYHPLSQVSSKDSLWQRCIIIREYVAEKFSRRAFVKNLEQPTAPPTPAALYYLGSYLSLHDLREPTYYTTVIYSAILHILASRSDAAGVPMGSSRCPPHPSRIAWNRKRLICNLRPPHSLRSLCAAALWLLSLCHLPSRSLIALGAQPFLELAVAGF